MTDESENNELQLDEIQSLSCIFGDEWKCVDEGDRVFNIEVIEEQHSITLQVAFSQGYPLNGPPIFRINAPWLSREAKELLNHELEHVYLQHIGECIVFMWVEKTREFLTSKKYSKDYVPEAPVHDESYDFNEEEYENSLKENPAIYNSAPIVTSDVSKDSIPMPEIIHGEPFTDRKSTFQAHVSPITYVEQVKMVTSKLLENRKIANATHNIMAYRIIMMKNNNETAISNCDDDGETGAASRMLFLMTTLGVSNVMVVVSRWFGGIHLGPDRFKHINNACREILEKNGYIKDRNLSTKKKEKKH